MRRKFAIRSLPLLLLAALAFGPATGRSQELDNLLERVLNPLPEFDPFDKPSFTPQYFPDEIDKKARDALVDALTDRREALEQDLRFFIEKDRQLKKERGNVTGLADQAQDLYNNTITDRQTYLEAQRKALSNAQSPQQKQLIESRLRNDDLTQAEDLLRKNTTNRYGAMLNSLLGSVDLANIVTGSYVGAAVDATVAALFAAGSSEMSSEERRALALLREHLKRHPDDPKNGEVRKLIEYLEQKKKKTLVQKQAEKAEEALKKKDPGKAEFYYQVGALIDPLSSGTEAGLEKLKKESQQKQEEKKKALSVSAEPSPASEKQTAEPEFTDLLYALAARNQAEIAARATMLEIKYRGSPLAESARDAAAVALEIKGQHEEAKKILEEIARSGKEPHESLRAQSMLGSPDYNLLASFEDARTRHRLDTVKYVLLGDDFLRRNLAYGLAPVITGGAAGAASLAAVNAIIIATNLVQVLTNNPISNQEVIDRGVDYIRNHPESSSATEVYRVLADAYEDVGMYEKAIDYHEMSGKAESKKIAELKDKAAKRLLQAASKSQERGTQEVYLKAILDDYPESAAAKEATQKLSRMTKIENQGLRMSKRFLMDNPELYGPQGLRLKPSLFDGNLSNMELADEGISLLGDDEILLNFKTPWGTRSQSYPIEKQTGDRFQMALRKKNYEVAMADVNLRAKGSQGGIKNLPQPILTGNLGKKAEEAKPDDSDLSLVREAGGSTTAYPKVLDHRFVSESEKETASKLPPIQGSISRGGFDLSGALPAGLWGDQISLGASDGRPAAGVRLPIPIPLLQGFIPVDFMVQSRAGRLSVLPRIHLFKDKGPDPDLYR